MATIRETALQRGDLQEEEFVTPWGVVVITEMSAEVRLYLANRLARKTKDAASDDVTADDYFNPMLLRCILDPVTREQIFQPEDLPGLMARNRRTLQAIDKIIARLSKDSEEQLEEAKRLFSETQRARSSSSEPSASVEPSASL